MRKRLHACMRWIQRPENLGMLFLASFVVNICLLVGFHPDGEWNTWLPRAVLQAAQVFILELNWEVLAVVPYQLQPLLFVAPVLAAIAIGDLLSLSVFMLVPRIVARVFGGHVVIVGDSDFARALGKSVRERYPWRHMVVVEREMQDDSRDWWSHLDAKIVLGDASSGSFLESRTACSKAKFVFALTGDLFQDIAILREWGGKPTRRKDPGTGVALLPSQMVNSVHHLMGDLNAYRRPVELLSCQDVSFRKLFESLPKREGAERGARLVLVGFDDVSYSFLKNWVQFTVQVGAFANGVKDQVVIFCKDEMEAKAHLQLHSRQILDVLWISFLPMEELTRETLFGKILPMTDPTDVLLVSTGRAEDDLAIADEILTAHKNHVSWGEGTKEEKAALASRRPTILLYRWENGGRRSDESGVDGGILRLGRYVDLIHEIFQRIGAETHDEKLAREINLYWKRKYGVKGLDVGNLSANEVWSRTPMWERESSRNSALFYGSMLKKHLPGRLQDAEYAEYHRWTRQKAMQDSLPPDAAESASEYQAKLTEDDKKQNKAYLEAVMTSDAAILDSNISHRSP